ncbi:MAG TPA: hypothetical protein VNJ04_10675 [Gemmatimonadaceae bacterium]|nr:hypothetical protein [Gemmatimonadaceae bacterium]
MKITRIKLWLLADRGYPEGVVTLPEHVVGDLSELARRAAALTPGVSLHSVVETVWRLGCKRLDDNLARRIPLRSALCRPAPRGRGPTGASAASDRRRLMPRG